MGCMVVDAIDGGCVIIRSKPFTASDMSWGVEACLNPPRGLKFTIARGSLQ